MMANESIPLMQDLKVRHFRYCQRGCVPSTGNPGKQILWDPFDKTRGLCDPLKHGVILRGGLGGLSIRKCHIRKKAFSGQLSVFSKGSGCRKGSGGIFGAAVESHSEPARP